jgi:hypothetical protein
VTPHQASEASNRRPQATGHCLPGTLPVEVGKTRRGICAEMVVALHRWVLALAWLSSGEIASTLSQSPVPAQATRKDTADCDKAYVLRCVACCGLSPAARSARTWVAQEVARAPDCAVGVRQAVGVDLGALLREVRLAAVLRQVRR